MASTYTPLGVELQATGENAGTWGTKTNKNLQIIEQISGGFTQQALTSGGTVDIFAYGDVDTGSNTSYSAVSTGSNDTYSDVATGSNTSYSDAA